MDWVVAAAMMGVTVVGGVVASVCGFGFGAVAMATWPYFLPYQQAVAVSALCGLSTALMIAVPHHRSINFKILLPCSLVALCCSAASVQLSLGAAEKLMLHALGAMLIAAGEVDVREMCGRPGLILGPGCVIEPHTPKKFLDLVHKTVVDCSCCR